MKIGQRVSNFWRERWRKLMRQKRFLFPFYVYDIILPNNSITGDNHRPHTKYTVYNANQRAFIQQFTNERTRGSLWGNKSESDFTNRWNRPDNSQIIYMGQSGSLKLPSPDSLTQQTDNCNRNNKTTKNWWQILWVELLRNIFDKWTRTDNAEQRNAIAYSR